MLQKAQTSSSRSNFLLQQPRPSSARVAPDHGERQPQFVLARQPRTSWALGRELGNPGCCQRGAHCCIIALGHCHGLTFKMASDTNAEREKLTHTSLFYKSCRPLNGSWFILHGYLQMHSSDLLSNRITGRVRKEARKNTSQADHITCVSKGLRHERNQKAASGKFYFLFF